MLWPHSMWEHTGGDAKVTYELGTSLPEASMWLEVLAGPELSWLWALLISPMIVQGSLYINNPIHCLLAPHTGQRVVVGFDGSALSSVTLYGTARSYGKHKPMFKVSKSSLMPLPSISTSQSSKIVVTSLFLSPSSSFTGFCSHPQNC